MAKSKPQSFLSIILKLLGVLLLVGGLMVGGLIGWMYYPIEIKQPTKVLVNPKMRVLLIGEKLQQSGVELTPWILALTAKFSPYGAKIQAGEHQLQGTYNTFSLLQALSKPPMINEIKLVIPEGWTFRQFRKLLNEHPDIKHETQAMTDAEILQAVGATETHPEGLFFPDTYKVEKQSSDLVILKKAYQLQKKKMQEYWDSRPSNTPLKTPYEALILASIIEKETGQASDRPMVSAVFNNRLNKGMLLQTDPTVIYGLGEAFDGNLRKRDLQKDTPYNSYTRKGLPPSPIALPGAASMKAALNPAQSNALYFVARGDGSSYFSASLSEHNQAVAKYQLHR